MQKVCGVTQFHGQELSSAHPVQNFDIMKNKLINEVLDTVKNQCLNQEHPVISSSIIALFTEWPYQKQTNQCYPFLFCFA